MKTVLRRILYIILGLVALILVVASAVIGPYFVRIKHFPADTTAGYYGGFYLSAYEKAGANVRFLLVEGVGHDRRELQAHSTKFLMNLLQE